MQGATFLGCNSSFCFGLRGAQHSASIGNAGSHNNRIRRWNPLFLHPQSQEYLQSFRNPKTKTEFPGTSHCLQPNWHHSLSN